MEPEVSDEEEMQEKKRKDEAASAAGLALAASASVDQPPVPGDGDGDALMAAEGGDGKVAEEEKEGGGARGVLKGATSQTPKTLELQMWEDNIIWDGSSSDEGDDEREEKDSGDEEEEDAAPMLLDPVVPHDAGGETLHPQPALTRTPFPRSD